MQDLCKQVFEYKYLDLLIQKALIYINQKLQQVGKLTNLKNLDVFFISKYYNYG